MEGTERILVFLSPFRLSSPTPNLDSGPSIYYNIFISIIIFCECLQTNRVGEKTRDPEILSYKICPNGSFKRLGGNFTREK